MDPDAPEVVNLLDVRDWADATMLQISRVRQVWIDSYRGSLWGERLGPDDGDDRDAMTAEVVNVDVYFLILAAHQLLLARRRRLVAALPRLSRRHEEAIEALRTIREHYQRHRDAFFDGTASRPVAKLRRLDADAHPWGVSGTVLPADGSDVVVAGVLPLDVLEVEVAAIYNAADEALTEIQTQLQDGAAPPNDG